MNQLVSTSQLLEEAVDKLAQLPGIGRKTAFRLVFHLLRQPVENTLMLSGALSRLRQEIKYCNTCNNIADAEICSICNDFSRDKETICIVESIKDLISIETTGQYRGVYHVLGGLISPIDGMGPSNLTIALLESRLITHKPKELIIALSTTPEGDTTAFYIYRKFMHLDIIISTIARGVPIGDELEYTDVVTLAKSILNRVPFRQAEK